MKKLIYQGAWALPGKIYREFRISLPTGEQANFTLKPGDDLKRKLTEVQQRFSQKVA